MSSGRECLYIDGVTRLFALLSVLVAACVFSTTAVAHKRPPMQHFTIFGDSVASALDWVPTAKAEIEKGNRVTFELHPCGRLWTAGCLANGQHSLRVHLIDRAWHTQLGQQQPARMGVHPADGHGAQAHAGQHADGRAPKAGTTQLAHDVATVGAR